MKRAVLFALLFLAGCGQKHDTAWLGYGEGDYASIAPPQGGWLTSLDVQRGEILKEGDLLFSLDDTSQVAARNEALANLNQAEASLAQEKANFVFTQTELRRQRGLVHANAASVDALDQAVNNEKQSEAHVADLQGQIDQMQAALESAEYDLSQRQIVSLTSGTVQDIYYQQGEYVAAATPVVEILPPANIYVRFFVPEADFSKIYMGEKVIISCDGCKPMKATITFIANQEEYTPPVIFSNDVRQKLVFKVEARAPGGLPIHPGQPVDVRPM